MTDSPQTTALYAEGAAAFADDGCCPYVTGSPEQVEFARGYKAAEAEFDAETDYRHSRGWVTVYPGGALNG